MRRHATMAAPPLIKRQLRLRLALVLAGPALAGAALAGPALLGPTPALAQAASGGVGAVTLPGTPGTSPSGGETCVQVQVAGQKPSPFDCLNQQLQQQVQAVSQTQPTLPLSATSSSNQVGTFNEQGVAEQYGQNFGKSVIPYRPPAPTFSNPLRP